jgi:L-cysteine desulfidase
MGHRNAALTIPEAAVNDPESVEAIRAWVADGGLHCALNVNLWNEPGYWGILLADVARHVANAHHEMKGIASATTLKKIRELFEAELDSPTDQPKGKFI